MLSNAVATISLVLCPLLASPALSADKDELQGTWVLESHEDDGKKRDDSIGGLLKFSGNNITFESGDKKNDLPFNYRTDKSKSPKHIDLTFKNLDGKDVIDALGIYKIEGDALTICMGTKRGLRPTEFDSKQGVLMVHKRKKK